MSLYGYARVCTLDQDLGIQRAALKAAGCKVIRAEKASGARRDGRTKLRVLLDLVQPGETLVVTRIDRLTRSMKDLQDIVHELKEKHVALRATEQPVDTGTAAGKAFLDMLGVSPSSRPTCAASASSKASRRRKSLVFTRAANTRSIQLSCGACAARRSSDLLPSRVALASAAPASTACSGRISRRRSGPAAQAWRLLCGW